MSSFFIPKGLGLYFPLFKKDLYSSALLKNTIKNDIFIPTFPFYQDGFIYRKMTDLADPSNFCNSILFAV